MKGCVRVLIEGERALTQVMVVHAGNGRARGVEDSLLLHLHSWRRTCMRRLRKVVGTDKTNESIGLVTSLD